MRKPKDFAIIMEAGDVDLKSALSIQWERGKSNNNLRPLKYIGKAMAQIVAKIHSKFVMLSIWKIEILFPISKYL